MGISDLKFKSGDFAGKDVSSLSDTPSADGMSAAMLKERFDMIPKMMVALGNFNSLIDLLSGASGASNISALDIIGNVTTIQGILDKLGINMSVDVNQNLNDIIAELNTKETKLKVAELLLNKADRDLLNVAVADFKAAMIKAGWREDIPDRITTAESDIDFILSALGIGGTGGNFEQTAMNGIAIRLNTLKLTGGHGAWVSNVNPLPPGTYAYQYVDMPSIQEKSSILVSPTSGAYAYPGTPSEVLINGNIPNYINAGIYCGWKGDTELEVPTAQLMFSCSKIPEEDIYVDVMELINVGQAGPGAENVPSSNNHMHDISDINGLGGYDTTLQGYVDSANQALTEINLIKTTAVTQITDTGTAAVNQVNDSRSMALTAVTAEKVQSLSDISAAEAAAVARMATFDPDGVINSANQILQSSKCRSFMFFVGGAPKVAESIMSIISPMNLIIKSILLCVDTAPSGSDLIIDVNKNGETLYTTQGNRPRISITMTESTAVIPDITSIALGDKITISIDQADTSGDASNLSMTMICEVVYGD